MSLTKLMKDDDSKYIAVSDFIELMVKHTNDTSDVVIEYLVKYSFARGNDVKIYLKGCFNEYSDEWTLSELLANDTNKNLRPYTLSELKAEEDFARAYFLKKDIFNAKYIRALKLDYDSLSLPRADAEQQRLISKAPPPPNHIKASSPFKQRTIGNLIEAEKRKEGILPNGFQQMTMLYDYFTPHQACCFIAGLPPSFDKRNYDLEMAEVIIEGGFKSGKLIADDEQQIKSDNLKLFLYSKNWIMKGFNDSLTDDTYSPNKKNTAYQNRIAELEQQLADKEANASFMMGSPTVEQGEPKTSEQIINVFREQIAQLTAENKELKEQLKQAIAQPPANKDTTTVEPQDWQNMSEHIYPPELHLAMMIWQRIYGDNELKDSHITSHNGKFEAIAKRMNLNPQSTLGKRIRMVINTAHIKKKQTELAEQLQAIEQLNMPENQ